MKVGDMVKVTWTSMWEMTPGEIVECSYGAFKQALVTAVKPADLTNPMMIDVVAFDGTTKKDLEIGHVLEVISASR